MSELEVKRMIKNEFRERQALIEEYRRSRNPELLSETYKLNPVVAAVTLAPSMIPEMVENGVDPNYVVPAAPDELFFYTKPTTALVKALSLNGFEARYEVSSILLEAGADPNVLCHLPYIYQIGNDPDDAVSLVTLLLRHGAKPKVLCGHKPIDGLIEERGGAKLAEFIRDAQKWGVEVAHERWLNRDARLAEEAAQRDRERQQRAQLRQERRAVIRQTFAQDPDLRAALSQLKQSAAPCQTLRDLGRELGNFSCDVWLGELYTSRTCQSRLQQLYNLNRQQSRQACQPYEDSRQQLAKLFGEHTRLAYDVIDEAVSGHDTVPEIEQTYRADLRKLASVRDREARGEKAEDERRYQQGAAHLGQYIQQSFGEKSAADKIVEQSVADTRSALSAIDLAQKMAKINADIAAINARKTAQPSTASTARAKASASALPSLAKAPQSAAPSTKSAAKSECIAQSESKGPMENVPQRYCQYVFADNTENVSVGWDDYASEFSSESGSLEHARSALHSALLKKAIERCQATGYTRVHHARTFDFHKVAVGSNYCKTNNRMGSTFYLCVGPGSFICARSQ